MKRWLFLLWCSTSAAWGQLQLLIDNHPLLVFAGREQTLPVRLHNPTDNALSVALTTRLHQTTASTLAPIGEPSEFRTSLIQSQQTVVEQISIKTPPVRVSTQFCLEIKGVGRVPFLAMPESALSSLNRLSTESLPLGVFDPANHLNAALEKHGVKYLNLEQERGDCRLILAWTSTQELPEHITAAVKRGTALVWIRSHRLPSVFATKWQDGQVVLVPSHLVANMSDSPSAQYHLIRCAELALTPEAWRISPQGKEIP
jgi:hypothetical protein